MSSEHYCHVCQTIVMVQGPRCPRCSSNFAAVAAIRRMEGVHGGDLHPTKNGPMGGIDMLCQQFNDMTAIRPSISSAFATPGDCEKQCGCLAFFMIGELLAVLSCGHMLHHNCLTNYMVCPYCRQYINHSHH